MPKNTKLAVIPAAELDELRETAALAGDSGGSNRDRVRQTGDQIRYSPALYPWMRAYAEWLTLGCAEVPKVSLRLAKARLFARAPVTSYQIRLLEARADFVTYVNELRRGPLEQARARFLAAFPEYVEGHKEAFDKARAAGDYSAVARIAEPVLDRVIPKRSEAVAATQVNITLSPEQIARVATYEAPPLLVEEVAPSPATPDDSVL